MLPKMSPRICFTDKQRERRKHANAVRLELVSPSQAYQIRTDSANGHLQQQTVLTSNMVAEYNPNYDFIGAKYPEHHLIELSRKMLRLDRYANFYWNFMFCIPRIYFT